MLPFVHEIIDSLGFETLFVSWTIGQKWCIVQPIAAPIWEEGADKILDYYRASKGAFLCIQKNKKILHYGYIIKQSL